MKVAGAAKVIRSVKVQGEKKKRSVFYVRRKMLFDNKGRICRTPLELGVLLSKAIEQRDKETVAAYCWDALNFVHDGKVPKNWLGDWKKYGPTPLAI